jgi:hypothetical protein
MSPENEVRERRLRMTVSTEGSYFHQLIVVAAFLGGIAFTVLVQVLQANSGYEAAFGGEVIGKFLFALLIVLMAGVSVTFVFVCLIALPVAGNRVPVAEGRLAHKCFTYGVLGFLVMIPLLLWPYSKLAFVTILILEVALLVSARLLDERRR